MQSQLSTIGALGKVSWSGGKVSRCSIFLVTLLGDGEPVEASADNAELLLSRLRSLFKDRGTTFDCGTAFDLRNLGNGFEVLTSSA